LIFSEARTVTVDGSGNISFKFGDQTTAGLDPANFPSGSERDWTLLIQPVQASWLHAFHSMPVRLLCRLDLQDRKALREYRGHREYLGLRVLREYLAHKVLRGYLDLRARPAL
jgi:hypothetical protein